MKTSLLTITLSILMIVGGALAQTDQPQSKSKSKWENPRGTRGLKLSDEQKKDIQKIKYDLMQKQIDLRAKIAHARLDYGQLSSAESPDENAISSKIDEIARLQVQLKKNLLDGWFAVNKILTPEQQALWKKVLQHPGMARRHAMLRMRTNARPFGDRMGNGMMQRRTPGMGLGPMLNEESMFGEGPSSGLDNGYEDYLGPMADSGMLFLDNGTDDLDISDEPMMDNMDMMEQGMMMMGQDQFMKNRIEMLHNMINQNAPDSQAQDSTK